jgi:hypothetical protein
MPLSRPRGHALIPTAVALLLVSSPGLSGANGAAVIDESGPQVAWTRLDYEASVSVARTRARLSLSRIASDDAVPDLLSPPTGGSALRPAGDSLMQMSVDTVLKGSLFSTKRYRGRVWFDPADGRSLQRSRLREGSDGNLRLYRYTDEGVYRLRLEPRSRSESERPPWEWGKRREAFFPLDPDAHSCARVVDPAVLIYLVSRESRRSEPGRRSYCVFNKRELYRVTVSRAGPERSEVSYVLSDADGESRIEGPRDLLKIRLDAELLGPASQDAEPFELLGLERTIHLLLEPRLGIPVRVTGYTPRVGEGGLDLVRVELAAASPGD